MADKRRDPNPELPTDEEHEEDELARQVQAEPQPEGAPESEVKALPEGFNPKEFGLPTPEEWKAQQDALAEEKQRRTETQRAYHDNQTLFSQRMSDQERRYAELAEQVRAKMEKPPAGPTSADLFQRYQETKNPTDWFAAQQAMTQEIVARQMEDFRKQYPPPTQPAPDLQVIEERLRYGQTPDAAEIPYEELERTFVPTLGGTPPSIREYALLARVRKAKSVETFLDGIGKAAVEKHTKDIEGKRGRGRLPEIPPSGSSPGGETPDIHRMTMPEFEAKYGTEEGKRLLKEAVRE